MRYRPARRLPPGNRDFLLLLQGLVTSQLADRIYLFGLSWWVLVHTGSAAATGAVMVAFTVPLVLLGSFAGVVADRVNRKTIIVATDALRALVMAVVWQLAVSGRLDIWHVLVLVALSSALGAFFNPALLAAVPQIAGREGLTRANSLVEIVSQLSGLLGPAVGGLLFEAFGLSVLALVSAVTFAISALVEAFIRMGPPAAAGLGGFGEQWRDGWQYLRRNLTVRYIMLMSCAVGLFATPVLLGLQVMLRTVLGGEALEAGVLGSALSGGMLAGALVFSLKREGRKYPAAFGALLAAGLLVLAMAPVRSLLVLTVLVVAWGFTLAVGSVSARALLQELVPGEVMGRIFGLLLSLNMALGPVAYGLAGLAIDATSAPLVLVVLGIGLTVTVLLIPLIPGIRTC